MIIIVYSYHLVILVDSFYIVFLSISDVINYSFSYPCRTFYIVFLSIRDVIHSFIYLFNFLFNIDAKKPFLRTLNKVYVCM